LRAEDIIIYGDGSQSRSFCYVSDMIEGFIRFMNASDDCLGSVNLGNPGEFSIRELAERVIVLTGSKSRIVNRPLPSDDPMQRQPDISMAREKLSWNPSVSLELGLAETAKYFERLLSVGLRSNTQR